MTNIFGIYLMVATAVIAQGYRKFGLTCEDIECISGKKCIVSRVPCENPDQQEGEQCGTYPECKAAPHRFRRTPQMSYQPVGLPAPMPSGYPPPRPYPMQQPRQAFPQYMIPPQSQTNPQYPFQYQGGSPYAMEGQSNPQFYFSVGMSYPPYINYNYNYPDDTPTSFYSPYLPNFSTNNYKFSLPFLGGSS
ncbi:uncharacterized protein LOC108028199 isoform X2 [Drosophila biarmipes]|uniref:uncharacterized protein LOC108028199 isoform X2 n=1 Tax=Drosophila biarmipes TaxID=125945 RepID=UPI0007E615DD|nr:uncharacterized protein LOC108028199 isoform X2 [Drosophila biarmipes]